VFLSAYHFDGDPVALAAAHDLYTRFPPESLDLHVCVLEAGGITVFDACPSAEAFAAFSQTAEFRQALADARLPQPHPEPLGEVHDVACETGPRRDDDQSRH
jgi:hypothetical protein